MRAILCVLAFAFAGTVNAGELVIVHPGWTETMHGTFLQMNMTETTGGVEFEVTDYDAVKSTRPVASSKTIWHIGLWIDEVYDYSQARCSGYFMYNADDPILTIQCAE